MLKIILFRPHSATLREKLPAEVKRNKKKRKANKVNLFLTKDESLIFDLLLFSDHIDKRANWHQLKRNRES